jgi:hypothetical protein
VAGRGARLMQIHADIAQWRKEVEPELAVLRPGRISSRCSIEIWPPLWLSCRRRWDPVSKLDDLG